MLAISTNVEMLLPHIDTVLALPGMHSIQTWRVIECTGLAVQLGKRMKVQYEGVILKISLISKINGRSLSGLESPLNVPSKPRALNRTNSETITEQEVLSCCCLQHCR